MLAQPDMTTEVRTALDSGDITAAAALCREWRGKDPTSPAAHNFSGIAALHAGDVADAILFFTHATELAPGDARAWGNLGIAGRQAGRETEWIAACFLRAFALAPGNPDICYNLALAQHDQEMNREALETLESWPAEQALSEKAGWLKATVQHALGLIRESRNLMAGLVAVYPGRHEFWRALGDLAQELDEPLEAESAYRQAIAVNPEDLESLRGLGNLLVRNGRPDEGRSFLKCVFDRMGNEVDVHIQYAQALAASGIFIDARQTLHSALKRWPNSAELHFNLGLVVGECGDADLAEASVLQALKLDPNLFLARNYLGILLEKRRLFLDAESCYRQVIAQAPKYAEAYSNLANILWSRLELEAAEAHYRKAIDLKEDLAEAHLNLGMLLLQSGRYAEGWNEYRWRWKTSTGKSEIRPFDRPEWRGQDLSGTRLLVHAEQGFGDTIQFVRCMSVLAERGASVIFESPQALARLLQGTNGIDILYKYGDPIPEYDWHIPLLDIPGLLGMHPDSIPTTSPYLVAEGEEVQKWTGRLNECGPVRLNVGIVWAGNPKHAKDRERSLTADTLKPLASIHNVRWVNLYKTAEGRANQSTAPLALTDWTDELVDYAETAALIASLDLVIAVDTSVAHLAGALGKLVWILLPYAPDWRWGLKQNTTPWYPTATLFRQQSPNDWMGVINEVKRDILPICEKKAP